MNLDTIRNYVCSKINVYSNFISISNRNQYEYFSGKIIKMYPNIFIIVTEDGFIKSFSYSDIVIGSLKILDI